MARLISKYLRRPLLATAFLVFANGCSPYSKSLRRYIVDGQGNAAAIRAEIAEQQSRFSAIYNKSRGDVVEKDAEKEAWKFARQRGTPRAFARYLQLFPAGIHMGQATAEIELASSTGESSDNQAALTGPAADKQGFERVKAVGRGQAWEMFIVEHPDSQYIQEAKSEYALLIGQLANKFADSFLTLLVEKAIRVSSESVNSAPPIGPEEFSQLRGEAVHRLPKFNNYLCAQVLSQKILKEEHDAKMRAFLRGRIRLIIMSGIDAAPEGCFSAIPTADSARGDRVLLNAYRRVADLDRKAKRHELSVKPALLRSRGLKALLARVDSTVERFESQELAAEALSQKSSVGDKPKASVMAKEAAEILNRSLSDVERAIDRSSPLDEPTKNAKVYNLIASYLIALIETRHQLRELAHKPGDPIIATRHTEEEAPAEEEAVRQKLVESSPSLQAIEKSGQDLHRKASLLRKEALARTGSANQMLVQARDIRSAAFGESAHLEGAASQEQGEARDSIRRADARQKAAGYGAAVAGNNVGGDLGALAGWLIATTATSGTGDAQLHEDIAARRKVEARLAEHDAEAQSKPLEARAQLRANEADRLLQQAEIYDSAASAKRLLFEAKVEEALTKQILALMAPIPSR